jgi:hypothetical protein
MPILMADDMAPENYHRERPEFLGISLDAKWYSIVWDRSWTAALQGLTGKGV